MGNLVVYKRRLVGELGEAVLCAVVIALVITAVVRAAQRVRT